MLFVELPVRSSSTQRVKLMFPCYVPVVKSNLQYAKEEGVELPTWKEQMLHEIIDKLCHVLVFGERTAAVEYIRNTIHCGHVVLVTFYLPEDILDCFRRRKEHRMPYNLLIDHDEMIQGSPVLLSDFPGANFNQ